MNSPLISHYGLVFSICCLLFYYLLQKYFKMHSYNETLEVDRWIIENNLEMYRYVFGDKGESVNFILHGNYKLRESNYSYPSFRISESSGFREYRKHI